MCILYRLRQAGLPRPSRLWMVSAATGLGVRDMMRGLREELGYRGDLWVVGAQNGVQAGSLWLLI